MIKVTKLNKDEVFINADLIELIETGPDTALQMQGGRRIVVREPVDEVVKRFMDYKKFVQSGNAVLKP